MTTLSNNMAGTNGVCNFGETDSVTEDGGAMYVSGGATWLANNTFSNNCATGSGGAISYVHDCFPNATVPGEFLCKLQ